MNDEYPIRYLVRCIRTHDLHGNFDSLELARECVEAKRNSWLDGCGGYYELAIVKTQLVELCDDWKSHAT